MSLRARSKDRRPKDRCDGVPEREQVLEHPVRRLAPGQMPLRRQIQSSKYSKCAVAAQTENLVAGPPGRPNRVQRKGRIRADADSDLLHLGRKIKSRHQLDCFCSLRVSQLNIYELELLMLFFDVFVNDFNWIQPTRSKWQL